MNSPKTTAALKVMSNNYPRANQRLSKPSPNSRHLLMPEETAQETRRTRGTLLRTRTQTSWRHNTEPEQGSSLKNAGKEDNSTTKTSFTWFILYISFTNYLHKAKTSCGSDEKSTRQAGMWSKTPSQPSGHNCSWQRAGCDSSLQNLYQAFQVHLKAGLSGRMAPTHSIQW